MNTTINGGATWQGSGIYNGLAPGTYNVQIRDAGQSDLHTDTESGTCYHPACTVGSNSCKTDITCFGANNGSIIISGATGGYGTYRYTINGGTNWVGSGNFTNLTPGTYNVQIRDAVNTACVVVLGCCTGCIRAAGSYCNGQQDKYNMFRFDRWYNYR